MKIFSFLFLLVCFNISLYAQGQVIKANPIALLSGDVELYYERSLTTQKSFLVGAGVGSSKMDGVKYGKFSFYGEYRFYFSLGSLLSEAPRGFYAAPYGRYRYAKSDDGHFSFASIGGIAGYQWIIRDRYAVDAFVGQYANLKISERGELNTDATKYYGKTDTRMGVSLGIRL